MKDVPNFQIINKVSKEIPSTNNKIDLMMSSMEEGAEVNEEPAQPQAGKTRSKKYCCGLKYHTSWCEFIFFKASSSFLLMRQTHINHLIM